MPKDRDRKRTCANFHTEHSVARSMVFGVSVCLQSKTLEARVCLMILLKQGKSWLVSGYRSFSITNVLVCHDAVYILAVAIYSSISSSRLIFFTLYKSGGNRKISTFIALSPHR